MSPFANASLAIVSTASAASCSDVIKSSCVRGKLSLCPQPPPETLSAVVLAAIAAAVVVDTVVETKSLRLCVLPSSFSS
jgi:hypothetical protein